MQTTDNNKMTIENPLRFSFGLLRKERGSYLLMALVFATLVSVSVVSAWEIVTQRQGIWQKSKILNSRDFVVSSVLRNIRVATFYYLTIKENCGCNDMLFKCLLDNADDGAGCDCYGTDSAGIKLVYPIRLVNEKGQRVIGTSSDPAYYDFYGQACDGPSLACPFEVSGTYTILCPDGDPSCPQAGSLDITASVGVSADAKIKYPSLENLPVLKVKERVYIGNYWDSYFPVLPPPTPYGTPLLTGAGVGGSITNKMAQAGAIPGPFSAGGSGGSPVPVSSPVTQCGVGQNRTADGSCHSFSF